MTRLRTRRNPAAWLLCVLGLALGGWLLASAPTAAAQSAADQGPSQADKARAKDKYDAGVQAFEQGRFKDAIDLFLEGDSIVESGSFAFNICLAYEQMGDQSRALGWARTYLRRKPKAVDRAEVEQRIHRYEATLQSKGVQQVTVLSNAEGATVIIDDKARGVAPWTGDLPPGNHTLELRHRDFQDGRLQFALAADRSMDVSLQLVPRPAGGPLATAADAPGLPAESASAAASDAPADTPAPAVGPATWTAFGVGAAALIAALGLELARAGAEEDARTEPVQIRAAEHLDRMEDYRLIARILAGVGAGTVLLGGVLLIVDLTSAPDEAPAAARLGVGCTLGGGCGLVGQGSF